MKRIFIAIFIIIFSMPAYAAWDEATVETLTQKIRECVPDWNVRKTLEFLKEKESTIAGDARYPFGVFPDCGVFIQIMGDTILVDGKDITGNLGNKNTGSSCFRVGKSGLKKTGSSLKYRRISLVDAV